MRIGKKKEEKKEEKKMREMKERESGGEWLQVRRRAGCGRGWVQHRQVNVNIVAVSGRGCNIRAAFTGLRSQAPSQPQRHGWQQAGRRTWQGRLGSPGRAGCGRRGAWYVRSDADAASPEAPTAGARQTRASPTRLGGNEGRAAERRKGAPRERKGGAKAAKEKPEFPTSRRNFFVAFCFFCFLKKKKEKKRKKRKEQNHTFNETIKI
jgi:hypothetical protein